MSSEWPFGDLPRGRYAAIVADPPWSYACFSEKGKARSADRHYVTMAADAIEQLPVGELAYEIAEFVMKLASALAGVAQSPRRRKNSTAAVVRSLGVGEVAV